MASVLQNWVEDLPRMQQAVLISAIRGPDGLDKNHVSKALIRWLRRCVLYSAFDGVVLTDPSDTRGGSFTGPIPSAYQSENIAQGWAEHWDDDVMFSEYEKIILNVTTEYLRAIDAMPIHFHLHLMHAAEILGYKHPEPWIRASWHNMYARFVGALHLWPETVEQLDQRLGDSESGWLARQDEGGSCNWMAK